jgi:hypothetical protein
MSAHSTRGDKPLPPKSHEPSSQELHAAMARIKVHQIERLAYTEAANVKPPDPNRAKRRRALASAIYHWVQSRL